MLHLHTQRGCHSPHHVSCISWRLVVSAYGPVCGCWAFRLHDPHGLLPSWSHLSTWLGSAGGRRVRCRCQIWSWCHHWQHSSSTSWMPSQRCSACSHAGSQRPCNSTQGKLLHGWLRWWLHYLVRSCGHSCAGEDITYFSTSHNVTALVILT
ncbi:rCG50614, isoform CRA_c [Rattus norvegicus]|uniref:RCG50614, isoform CRA_c n=1 Tax=Rattus norvegicus TaxID=10116 RepID=A6KCL2_RAT|nr:rCG50614, isoform CRA_c [Rattus norvegicus]EDL86934.1 rCG50614, isoform CRA_c [Rattus norvegicus]